MNVHDVEGTRAEQNGRRTLWGSPRRAVCLGLDRIASPDPRLKTAQDGRDPCETVLEQDLRRTGAGLLGRSGAIGDDPPSSVELVFTVGQVGKGD